jgi:hypothetical protein
MYDADSDDRVVELLDLPESDPGAPMPALAASEHYLKVGYISLGRGNFR